MGNQPITTYRMGQLSISVFENGENKSYVFQKAYKDENGEWKNTSNLFDKDLLILSALCDAVAKKELLKVK